MDHARWNRRRRVRAVLGRAVCYALLGLALPGPLLAQDQEPDPADEAQIQIGPLALKPAVSVTDIGFDTNIFREETGRTDDMTATVRSRLDSWLRLGAARLHVVGQAGYLYFRTYSEERSFNTGGNARLDMRLGALRPWVAGSWSSTRERQGYEIDARVRREDTGTSAGADLRIGGRTTLGVAARQLEHQYGDAEQFLGTSLANALTRRSRTAEVSVRQDLTPLTRLVLQADRSEDTFEFASFRDGRGVRILPGVEFDALALIAGHAYVGYRRLDFSDASVVDYTGLVAQIDLSYTLSHVTRFTVAGHRDVDFSFDPTQPYYVLSGLSASVRQRLVGAWDVEGRAARQRLDYRAGPPTTAGGRRVDQVSSFGAGVGYAPSTTMRVSFNVDRYARTSEASGRGYDGVRVGTSVNYGF